MSRQVGETAVIERHADRRFYDTEVANYVTLADLADTVRAGRDIEVRDARTGEDITCGVLMEIIASASSPSAEATANLEVASIAQRALLEDVDKILARLETGIARERDAMNDLLERVMLRRAA